MDTAFEGMSGVTSVDATDAVDGCQIFRHGTVESAFMGFLDDFWVCVKKGPCDPQSTEDNWQVLAQGQLRTGQGDADQNYKHVQEFQDGVAAAAKAAGVDPMVC